MGLMNEALLMVMQMDRQLGQLSDLLNLVLLLDCYLMEQKKVLKMEI